MPNKPMASISRLVAMGRLMKVSEIFICAVQVSRFGTIHHKDTKAAKEHQEPALCFFVFFVPSWFKPASSGFALQPSLYHNLTAVVW
jgi:hypothetical protein